MMMMKMMMRVLMDGWYGSSFVFLDNDVRADRNALDRTLVCSSSDAEEAVCRTKKKHAHIQINKQTNLHYILYTIK